MKNINYKKSIKEAICSIDLKDNDKKTFYTSREGYFGHQKIFYITERNDKRRFLESFSLDFENFFSQQQFQIDCNIDIPCDIYVASGNDKFVHVSDI